MPETLSSFLSHVGDNEQGYQHFADRGIRYAMAILRNHCDSEEAVQEVFFRLHSKQIDFGDQAFSGKFFKSLRNHCIDLLRKRRVRGEVSDLEVAEVAESRSGCNAVVDTHELQQSIELELRRLPENWRQAVLLKIHGELTYDEIASVLDATRPQVRTWIYRARRQLEQRLVANGYIESKSNDR